MGPPPGHLRPGRRTHPDRLLVRNRTAGLHRRPSETLTFHVPFSEGAFDQLVVTQRRRDRWVAASVVSTAATAATLAAGVPGRVTTAVVVCLVGSLVSAAVSLWHLASVQVRARLDGSRRWVTLSNVDPTFAAAAADQAKVQQIRLGVPAARV